MSSTYRPLVNLLFSEMVNSGFNIPSDHNHRVISHTSAQNYGMYPPLASVAWSTCANERATCHRRIWLRSIVEAVLVLFFNCGCFYCSASPPPPCCHSLSPFIFHCFLPTLSSTTPYLMSIPICLKQRWRRPRALTTSLHCATLLVRYRET